MIIWHYFFFWEIKVIHIFHLFKLSFYISFTEINYSISCHSFRVL
jgi:hypothetical protein